MQYLQTRRAISFFLQVEQFGPPLLSDDIGAAEAEAGAV